MESLDRLAERRRAAGPGRTLVCATVGAATLAAQAAERTAAEGGAALVEHRLDLLGPGEHEPGPRFFATGTPTLATCRPGWEGGGFDGAEDVRRRRLEGALEAGATLIDVEAAAPWRGALLSQMGSLSRARVVLSCHDFGGIPADLESRVRALLAEPVAYVKYAVLVKAMHDLVGLEDLARRAADPRLLLVAMGECGVAARVLAFRLRAPWTYGGDGFAPGQLSWRRLVEEFRVPSLGANTRVRALVGRPLGHSLSPAMHNAASAARGEDAVYVPCEVETFDDFLGWAHAWGIEGASVTAPFKGEAAAAARTSDELVSRLGAANTLRRTGDGWEARNTDVAGFLAPLEGRDLTGLRAVVLGAGGGAAAAAAALHERGAAVAVAARRPGTAERLASRLGVGVGSWPPEPGTWDVLVNATPVGTWPDVEATPVEASRLRRGATVYDLVYRPAVTRLLREAGRAGCETIGGLPMLVAQAEHQFAWWTGAPAPSGVMRSAAEREQSARAPLAAMGGIAGGRS